MFNEKFNSRLIFRTKFFFFIILFFVSVRFNGQNAAIKLNGTYWGKNLIIQNPYSGTGFCTKKVFVNGKEIEFKNATAFEINLKGMRFKLGDPIEISIEHENDCKPKVLNPGDNHPPRLYNISKIKLENDSMLCWKSFEDSLTFVYIIQQFRWNHWMNWDTIKSGEKKDTAIYSSCIKKYFHSGKNLFRIKSEFKNLSSVSKQVEKKNPEEKLLTHKSAGYHGTYPVDLGKETYWILFDQYGNILKKGYGKSFYINDLPKGFYFLNYDNKMTEVGWY